MHFHKLIFPIRMITTAPRPVELVSGWRLDGTNIGFYRSSNGRMWIASDLISGTRICKFPTRRKCVEWCIENRKKINNRMNTAFYIQRVKEFRLLLEDELEDLIREELKK